MEKENGWWTVTSVGTVGVRAYPTDWPRGPWKSEREADEALDRWVVRRNLEDQWDQMRRAHRIEITGPFPTREAARRA